MRGLRSARRRRSLLGFGQIAPTGALPGGQEALPEVFDDDEGDFTWSGAHPDASAGDVEDRVDLSRIELREQAAGIPGR
jgi:hypothetical protein